MVFLNFISYLESASVFPLAANLQAANHSAYCCSCFLVSNTIFLKVIFIIFIITILKILLFFLSFSKFSPSASFPLKNTQSKALTELNLRYISVMPSALGTSSFSSYLQAVRLMAGVTWVVRGEDHDHDHGCWCHPGRVMIMVEVMMINEDTG